MPQGMQGYTDVRYIGRELIGDLGVAALAAALVVPPIAIIDRAVVEQIAQRKPLFQSLRVHGAALQRPLQLLLSKPGGIIWALYASTYAVANSSETIAKRISTAPAGPATFVATMLVNVPMGVWKDVRFSQIYGSQASKIGLPKVVDAVTNSKVSVAATASFLLRDGLTIFASFVLVPKMAAAIPDQIADSSHSKAVVAQITAPILSQLVATPMHLLGISLQSSPQRVGVAHRIADIRRDLPVATVVRCIRIIPAFSLGCLLNSELRALSGTSNGLDASS